MLPRTANLITLDGGDEGKQGLSVKRELVPVGRGDSPAVVLPSPLPSTHTNTNSDRGTVSANGSGFGTTTSGTFRCASCHYLAYTTEHLREHVNLEHLDFTPYGCRLCGIRMATFGRFYHHKEKEHAEIPMHIFQLNNPYRDNPEKERQCNEIVSQSTAVPSTEDSHNRQPSYYNAFQSSQNRIGGQFPPSFSSDQHAPPAFDASPLFLSPASQPMGIPTADPLLCTPQLRSGASGGSTASSVDPRMHRPANHKQQHEHQQHATNSPQTQVIEDVDRLYAPKVIDSKVAPNSTHSTKATSKRKNPIAPRVDQQTPGSLYSAHSKWMPGDCDDTMFPSSLKRKATSDIIVPLPKKRIKPTEQRQDNELEGTFRAIYEETGQVNRTISEQPEIQPSGNVTIVVLSDSSPGSPNSAVISASRCTICNHIPKSRRSQRQALKDHNFGHLARDFKIFRFACQHFGCSFQTAYRNLSRRHQQRCPTHKVDDRFDALRDISQSFLDNRTPEEYQSEVRRATQTGHAFGEDISHFRTDEPQLLEGAQPEELGRSSIVRQPTNFCDVSNEMMTIPRGMLSTVPDIHCDFEVLMTSVFGTELPSKSVGNSANLCDICLKNFSRNSHLKEHQFAVHMGKERKVYRYICTKCPFVTAYSKFRDQHFESRSHSMVDRTTSVETELQALIEKCRITRKNTHDQYDETETAVGLAATMPASEKQQRHVNVNGESSMCDAAIETLHDARPTVVDGSEMDETHLETHLEDTAAVRESTSRTDCHLCAKTYQRNSELLDHQWRFHLAKVRQEYCYVCDDCDFKTGDCREKAKHIRQLRHNVSDRRDELKKVIQEATSLPADLESSRRKSGKVIATPAVLLKTMAQKSTVNYDIGFHSEDDVHTDDVETEAKPILNFKPSMPNKMSKQCQLCGNQCASVTRHMYHYHLGVVRQIFRYRCQKVDCGKESGSYDWFVNHQKKTQHPIEDRREQIRAHFDRMLSTAPLAADKEWSRPVRQKRLQQGDKCPLCFYRFNSYQNLMGHLYIYHLAAVRKIFRFQCTQCNFVSGKTRERFEHCKATAHKVEDKSEIVRVQLDIIVSETPTAEDRLWTRSSNKESVRCDASKETTPDRSSLSRCPLCTSTYSRAVLLKEHLYHFHLGVVRKIFRYKCRNADCGIESGSRGWRQYHQQTTNHQIGDRRDTVLSEFNRMLVEPALPGDSENIKRRRKKFAAKGHLAVTTSSRRIRRDCKPSRCTMCTSLFTSNANLLQHQYSYHLGAVRKIYRYHCKTCGSKAGYRNPICSKKRHAVSDKLREICSDFDRMLSESPSDADKEYQPRPPRQRPRRIFRQTRQKRREPPVAEDANVVVEQKEDVSEPSSSGMEVRPQSKIGRRCSLCSTLFANTQSLRRHKYRFHLAIVRKIYRYQCVAEGCKEASGCHVWFSKHKKKHTCLDRREQIRADYDQMLQAAPLQRDKMFSRAITGVKASAVNRSRVGVPLVGEQNGNAFKCRMCSRRFLISNALTRHYWWFHLAGVRKVYRYTCQTCDKASGHERWMQEHKDMGHVVIDGIEDKRDEFEKMLQNLLPADRETAVEFKRYVSLHSSNENKPGILSDTVTDVSPLFKLKSEVESPETPLMDVNLEETSTRAISASPARSEGADNEPDELLSVDVMTDAANASRLELADKDSNLPSK